jgi:hypothetical protein
MPLPVGARTTAFHLRDRQFGDLTGVRAIVLAMIALLIALKRGALDPAVTHARRGNPRRSLGVNLLSAGCWG